MAVNTAFHTSNLHSIATERNLYSDLIKEAIQIYGHDVYYMDRDLVAEDTVWGEDSLSKFKGVTMLGGVEMDGETLFSQALEEQNKLEEQIQLAFELPINYMVG